MSVEVLLKARLSREHWTLILKDVNKADARALMNGESLTVTPSDAVERLVRISQLPLKETDSRTNKSHAGQVDELVRLRNRAAHFNFEGADPVSIRGTLAVGLNFVLWFLDQEFRSQGQAEFSGVRQMVEELIEDAARELGGIEELVRERLASLADELAEADILLECPRCTQFTLMIGEGVEARCPFCRAPGANAEDIAGNYLEEILGLSAYEVIKNGGDWPLHDCPNCGAETLVEGIQPEGQQVAAEVPHEGESDYRWGCFACGYLARVDDLMRCDRCGRLNEHPTCPDCFANLLAD